MSAGIERRENEASRPRPELSVVIPVWDEAPCLGPLWARLEPVLRSLSTSWEAVFVDDGSTDESPQQLRRIRSASPAVRIVTLAANGGQSAALDAGVRAARGRWILTLDADLQNPPEEIPRMLAAREGADMVFGRRRTRRDGWVRRVSSRVGNAVRNAVTGHRVRDTGCSLKLFRRDAMLRIPAFQGMHRFLPTLFAIHGYRLLEVEVEHAARVAGRAKYGIRGRAWRGLVDCLGVRWLRARSLRYRAHETGDEDGDA
jgi:dolichol-phosphate mannosyltransferase